MPKLQDNRTRLGYTNLFRELRPQVLKRDNNECQICFKPAIDVHHVIPLSKGGMDSLDNLVSVCKKCHKIVEIASHKRLPKKHIPFKLGQSIIARLSSSGDRQLIIIPRDQHVGRQLLGRHVRVTVSLV